MYVITGATGNIGKPLAEMLLSKGQKVRVVGRSKERLKSLIEKGADPFTGSVDDTSAMAHAFSGAKAIFAMIPPDPTAKDTRAHQNKIGEALAKAIVQSGVKYVVNLSSVGAHLSEKVGPVTGLYDQEQRLNQLKEVHLLHLRPTYFMENLLWNAGLIKNMGINGTSLKGDISIPMIATRDIAADAAERLLHLDFSGKSTRELLGQRNISMNEVTEIIGKTINKPGLKYMQFSYEESEKAMVGMGLSQDYARALNELTRAFNEGILKPTEKRTEKNSTPTSFEEFAKTFAAIYNGKN
ncbi:MAG: SDR family NAD(P)-dependent oxidoreductase [Nitrospirae bacterium]|nr:SDR family NAD(P)-dependent oxidoreductase [Nitrospirota bacterium]